MATDTSLSPFGASQPPEHAPLTQVAPASHASSQPPQLAESVVTSTQPLAQHSLERSLVASGSQYWPMRPRPQGSVTPWQLPLMQDLSSGQREPQMPQLPGSLPRSAQDWSAQQKPSAPLTVLQSGQGAPACCGRPQSPMKQPSR